MKKTNLFLLLSLFCLLAISCQSKQGGAKAESTSCSYENDVVDLGVGVAVWSYDCEQDIVIYSDTILGEKAFEFNICNSDTSGVCPLFYKPDYGNYHFAVTQKSDKWYEIVYNTNQRGYLPANALFQFVGWDTFLKDYLTGIREKGKETIYTVETISGDSASVVEREGSTSKTIQWKTDNQLLIEILLLE